MHGGTGWSGCTPVESLVEEWYVALTRAADMIKIMVRRIDKHIESWLKVEVQHSSQLKVVLLVSWLQE